MQADRKLSWIVFRNIVFKDVKTLEGGWNFITEAGYIVYLYSDNKSRIFTRY